MDEKRSNTSVCKKKIFTKKDEFCIKESRGVLIDYIPLGKDALIMPKNSWKEEHLSLTTIEKIHDIMDVTSLVPILPISIGSDLTNAAVYVIEKNMLKCGCT